MNPICTTCGAECVAEGCASGYALAKGETGALDRTICYQCAADLERARMIETGRATLYLVGRLVGENEYRVTDWPGRLSFPARVRKGKHNIARTRTDAWFTGPDGREWHGVQYGEFSQLIRCRRKAV